MLTFKRGSTFDFSGQISVTDAGVAVADLTGWTVTCQLRPQSGGLIADLQFTWLDASQRLCRIRSTTSTAAWPEGVAEIDIRLVSPSGDVVATDTTQLQIARAVTRA